MNKLLLKLRKTTAIYGVGTAVNRFIALLLLPLFTKYLTPVDYGVLAMLALLSMVVQPIFSLGISAAMGPVYFENDRLVHKSVVTWSAFFLLLASVFLLLTIAWSMPGMLSRAIMQSNEYALLVSCSLTGCAFTILVNPFILRIQFEERAAAFVIITLTGSLVSILASVCAVVVFNYGVTGMVVSQAIGQVFSFILFGLVAVKDIRPGYSLTVMKELLNLGLPFMPSFAFLFVILQGNRYILQSIEGLGQVGIYSIGFNIGMAMSIAISGYTQAWYPFFMKFTNNVEEASDIIGAVFRCYVTVFGILVILFFVLAGPVVQLLTEQKFHDAYKIVGFSALAQYMVGIFSTLTPGAYYKKEIKFISMCQGFAALLSVPINLFFISQWGLLGAGIGLAVSTSLLPISQWLWNEYRKEDYVAITYYVNRISFMPVAIVGFILATLTAGRAGLSVEIFILLLAVICLAIYTYTFVIIKELKHFSQREIGEVE